jgi:phosphoribosyl-dephospho-CoA transferase
MGYRSEEESAKQRVGLVCKRYAQYCHAGHYHLTLLLLDNIKATANDSGIKRPHCVHSL